MRLPASSEPLHLLRLVADPERRIDTEPPSPIALVLCGTGCRLSDGGEAVNASVLSHWQTRQESIRTDEPSLLQCLRQAC